MDLTREEKRKKVVFLKRDIKVIKKKDFIQYLLTVGEGAERSIYNLHRDTVAFQRENQGIGR